MGTKLTLRMDPRVIERAKRYAQARGKSVSQLVSDYFTLLEAPGPPARPSEETTETLPPITRSLVGALRDTQVDEGDYRIHLLEKYG